MGAGMTMEERRAALHAALDNIKEDAFRRREAESLLFWASDQLGDLARYTAENHRKSGGEDPDEVYAQSIVGAFGIAPVRSFGDCWSSETVEALAGCLWEGANALRRLREEDR